jgi:hypothetical protein
MIKILGKILNNLNLYIVYNKIYYLILLFIFHSIIFIIKLFLSFNYFYHSIIFIIKINK